MAGTPEVKVRISAQDDLDKGLAGASRSLGDFAGKIPLIGAAVAAAGAAVAAFAKGAIEEASAAELGMGRLRTAVENTGGSFDTLGPQIEDAVTKFTRLTTATDDDLRAALTNLITVSGDTQGSIENLGLVTDLAAYKNIELSDAATIVGKAMNGTTTQLNKMGVAGKDATTVLENARASFGGFAETQAKTFSGSLQRIVNQWGEFKEAVGVAVLEGGNASAMADGLAGVLAGLVGWVERNEESFIIVAGVVRDVAGALFEVGKTVYQTVQPALGPVMKVLIGALLTTLQSATFGVRFLAATFKGMAGDSLQALGTLVEKGGSLLKVFGVNVVAESGKSIKEFGAQLAASAVTTISDAKEQWTAGMAAILTGRKRSNELTEAEEQRTQRTQTRIASDGLTERQRKERDAAEVHRLEMARANQIFEDTIVKLQRPELRGMAADWSEIDKKALEVAKSIRIGKEAQGELADATEGVRRKQEAVLEEADKAKQKFDDNVDSVRSIGASMVDLGQATGVFDQKAASALNSVLNMGASIAKFGLGSPEGILSVVGGLANLIGNWGNSASEQARKQALRENTERLKELSRDLSEYNLGVSGFTFSGVTDALGKFSQLVAGNEDFFSEGPGKAIADKELAKLLEASGVSMSDVRKLAEKYNIKLDGAQGFVTLFKILRSRKFGSPEGNFGDELAALQESFDVLGVSDEDEKLRQFTQLIDQNIPVLKGVLGDLSTEQGRESAAARLRQLYKDSIGNKIAIADYGNASPGQFRSIVSSLLQLLGKADGLIATPSPSGAAAGNVAAGAASIPNNFAALGIGGLGVAPGPTPSIGGGGVAPSLALGGDTIGTQIMGDFAPVFNVYQQDGESSEEFVERLTERVLSIAGQKYVNQSQALGARL